jgi:hypothetical protein
LKNDYVGHTVLQEFLARTYNRAVVLVQEVNIDVLLLVLKIVLEGTGIGHYFLKYECGFFFGTCSEFNLAFWALSST